MEVDPHQFHQSKKSAVFDFQEAFLLHNTCGILVVVALQCAPAPEKKVCEANARKKQPV